MGEYHIIHDVKETTGAQPDELFLVEADDLRHWADAARTEERRACRRIVENHLRTYLVEQGVNPASIMASMIAKIDQRGLRLDGSNR